MAVGLEVVLLLGGSQGFPKIFAKKNNWYLDLRTQWNLPKLERMKNSFRKCLQVNVCETNEERKRNCKMQKILAISSELGIKARMSQKDSK